MGVVNIYKYMMCSHAQLTQQDTLNGDKTPVKSNKRTSFKANDVWRAAVVQ